MLNPKFAKVAVSVATIAIDMPYDYSIPGDMMEQAVAGMRVLVPFGRGNKQTEAIILSVFNESEYEKTKPISRLLDEQPVLTPKDLKLAAWIRERFFCTYFDAIRILIPAGLWYRIEPVYCLNESTVIAEVLQKYVPSEDTAIITASLGAAKEGRTKAYLSHLCEGRDVSALLDQLVRDRVLAITETVNQNVKDKYISLISLNVSAEEAQEFASRRKNSAPMQASVIKLLSEIGTAAEKEIKYFTGASAATIKALAKSNMISFSEQEVFRKPSMKKIKNVKDFTLNQQQETAFHGIANMLEQKKAAVALLYGVTGSGKTQVYLKLVKKVCDEGGQSILLVPEIALTPQLTDLFYTHFGWKVAVLHSALSHAQRYDEWKRIKDGQVSIVIGTRSAIFAPLDQLRLIIIDEEQEYSYKSENTPRYHARDVAKYRCFTESAVLLLGSATPSIETFYSAQEGIYRQFNLADRYNQKQLPSVLITDMKQELAAGNGSDISNLLALELGKNIASGRQSILFMNRRGNSRLLVCGVCGYIPFCPRCSVALVYHSANNRLICHHCGFSQLSPEQCPECEGKLKQVGSGTQKVVQQLEVLFPGTQVLRMDADTTMTKNSHAELLSRFEQEKIPVLVGTQMVTKGLDFANVTLVGVLSADLTLYMDSYRAGERTFSLITQVVGRSGRGRHSGRAVIQTFHPDHSVIGFAKDQDYMGFYGEEIEMRRAQGLPPFSELFMLTVLGRLQTEVQAACVVLKKNIIEYTKDPYFSGYDIEVLGPAPAFVAKVNNKYRYTMTLRCKNDRKTRQLIFRILKDFKKSKKNRKLIIFVDINPE